MNQSQTPPDKDPRLWELAKKRTDFKSNLFSYIVVNIFLWLIWYFSGNRYAGTGWPWPLWVTLGWGIGIAFHYFSAYINPELNSVDKEYEKLKEKEKSKL